MNTYYTRYGELIRNPKSYASTGAPMYKTKYSETKDINTPTIIYKLNLKYGKNILVKLPILTIG